MECLVSVHICYCVQEVCTVKEAKHYSLLTEKPWTGGIEALASY